ncbi:MAG TPA: MarR family transcriptional regulator [Pseudonocardiaceae bacterium]|jgi:DNA-binding MarR family transcriptional regulator|nr:MarR family transcriptional regulator [Pseudonocardiaceae bacterium]
MTEQLVSTTTDPGTDAEAAGAAGRAWAGMRTLVLDLHDRRKEVSAALEMSFIRAKALRKLAGGPLTMRELTAGLATDPPYTTLVVDDLERRGLVERTVHPTDRRAKIVSMTPAGRVMSERGEAILNEPPAALLALDPADIAVLDRIVAALLAAG